MLFGKKILKREGLLPLTLFSNNRALISFLGYSTLLLMKK